MSSSRVPQWLDLDGVVNMRDVGGIPVRGGGLIASGRLIRSDNLQELPPASVRRLVDELDVTDVVDLRTGVEVVTEGEGPLLAEPAVRVHHLSLFTEDTQETGIPAGETVLPWERRDAGVQGAADDERSQRSERPDSVVAALRVIATSRGATVVHCAAGKDRTGTVVALALLLAGAEPEAVAADFAVSAERVPQIMERLSRRPAYAANLAGKTVAQQSPRPDTMRRLIEAFDALEGGAGVEAWLTRQGWTSADAAALRSRLRAG